jgi:hypothetical protein
MSALHDTNDTTATTVPVYVEKVVQSLRTTVPEILDRIVMGES